MNIDGNYNFGVWNPPTGVEFVRFSEQFSASIAINLNNLQTGREQGIRQSFGVPFPEFKDIDIDLITYLNDNNLKVFTGMQRQGWGGSNEYK